MFLAQIMTCVGQPKDKQVYKYVLPDKSDIIQHPRRDEGLVALGVTRTWNGFGLRIVASASSHCAKRARYELNGKRQPKLLRI